MTQKKRSLENALLYLIYIGLLVVLLTPLLHSAELYYPYVTLKNFVFRFSVEFMSVAWFILISKDKRFFPNFHPLHLSVMVFMAILSFANALGVDPGLSMWGNLERMEGLVTLIHLFIYMIIIGSVLKTKKQWAILANISLIIALIVGIIGLSDLTINSKTLITSTFGNTSYLAIYSLFHIFLAMLFYVNNKERKHSYIYLLLSLLFGLVLYNTGTRGTFIALFCGVIVSMVLYEKKLIRKILIYGALPLLVSGAALWSLKSSSFVQNSQTLKRIVDIDGATSTRIKVWKVALLAIKEKPITGWGQENFNYVLDRYYDSSLGDAEWWFDRVHNVLLDWTVAAGFPGLLSYLMIFVTAFWGLWSTRKKLDLSLLEKSILSGVLVAYFVNNLFLFDSISSYILFFSVLAFISKDQSSEQLDVLSKERKAGILTIIFCSVLFMNYCFYFVNLPALKVARGIIQAIAYNQQGEKNKAIYKIEEISFIESFAQNESYEYLGIIAPTYKTLSVLKDSAHAKPLSVKKSYIYLATAAKLKHPDLEDIFLETIALSPKRQVIYFEMIYYYLRLNNFEKALELSRINYEINTEINRSKLMYALCSILVHDFKLSDELIAKVPVKEYVLNKMFIEAYTSVQRMDRVIDFYQKSIVEFPKDPDNHLKLGMIFREMGKEIEAQREFEISKELAQKKLSE